MKYFRLIVLLILSGLLIGGFGDSSASSSAAAVDLNAGDYDPTSPIRKEAVTHIHVQCSPGTCAEIRMGSGQFGSSIHSRGMQNSDGDRLAYNLYTDSSHATVWGDGTNGSSFVPLMGTGSPQSFAVYLVVPAGQSVRSGQYTDTVTISVSLDDGGSHTSYLNVKANVPSVFKILQ